jgi:transcriptional regulator with XRE-family HTH domain
MNIETAIKLKILSSGMKQGHVARKVGMTDNQLSAVLLGRRRLKASEFLRICEFLKIDVNQFKKGD